MLILKNLIDYVKIYNTYLKFVLDEESNNLSEYSELDFQVKYLLKEVRVPINDIIKFAGLKFKLINEVVSDLLSDIPFVDDDIVKGIVETIVETRRGTLKITFFDKRSDLDRDFYFLYNIDGDSLEFISKIIKFIDDIKDHTIKNITNFKYFCAYMN